MCVDRLSGWIIAVPCLDKGLTGAKLAQIMLKEWSPFGIPSVMTSDRGSHFTGAWWRTFCAELGIRHAYAHVYHHQANGRAEVAGQQIKEVLRKILVEENLTWVEALPRVLNKIHDAKGVGGLSPYEIMFGRYRPLANAPYEPEKECEDAKEFFNRMLDSDERISRILNGLHDQRMVWENRSLKTPEPFVVGDKAWYRRPEEKRGPLDSRWLGPVEIMSRVGESSYEILVKPGKIISAHQSWLKPYKEDMYNKAPVPLNYHRLTVVDEGALGDEFVVEEILDHRVRNGKEEYLTWWRGSPKNEATWEPPTIFSIDMLQIL